MIFFLFLSFFNLSEAYFLHGKDRPSFSLLHGNPPEEISIPLSFSPRPPPPSGEPSGEGVPGPFYLPNRIPFAPSIHGQNNLFLWKRYANVFPDQILFSNEQDPREGEVKHNCLPSSYSCSVQGLKYAIHFIGEGRVPLEIYDEKPQEITLTIGSQPLVWEPVWSHVNPWINNHSMVLDESFRNQHQLLFDMLEKTLVITPITPPGKGKKWMIIPLVFFSMSIIHFHTCDRTSLKNTKQWKEKKDLCFFSTCSKQPLNAVDRIIQLLSLFTYFTSPDIRLLNLFFLYSKDIWIQRILWTNMIADAIWNCLSDLPAAYLSLIQATIGATLLFKLFFYCCMVKAKIPLPKMTTLRLILYVFNTFVFFFWMNGPLDRLVPEKEMFPLLFFLPLTFALQQAATWTRLMVIVDHS